MNAGDTILKLQAVLLIPEGERARRVGPRTRAAFERLASMDAEADWSEATVPAGAVTALVPMGVAEIPKAAIALIIEAEGIDQPGKWPGGSSGITLGYGCDIGADPKSLEYWRGILSDEQINRLSHAKGKTGGVAAMMASHYRDIKITKEQAERVFYGFTLPVECALTRAKFPGSEQLPGLAFGALVSLVFNRGTSLGIDDGDPKTHDSREEMRAIFEILKDGVQNGDLAKIALEIRDMKRLWAGKGLDGLITRRENEAKLVEAALAA